MKTEWQWQLIETAPRDGSWIVVACFDGGDPGYEVGRYDPLFWDKYVEVDGGLYRKEQASCHEWGSINNFHRATHWMPLPAKR